jgi:lipopolysaccharide transport system ATP-binding protein
MSDVVIKAEGISKQYRLGKIGTGTLAHDVNRLWHKALGKDDPYSKVDQLQTQREFMWALRDISFDIRRGDAVGIIGKNGAGKSTLLKILSRTTAPTSGDIKVKGRIASLLEVGTGFHPELTGRENIFLNGAILGMSKREIRARFDEIVDFSGVEKYIDTPVKRYSSGMYVRLAFAVAAHLEPDILIVDEVLAVGDAEFQKKCLGKMKSVSNSEGRTVLFVSHTMTSIQALCSNAIFLSEGFTHGVEMVNVAVAKYLFGIDGQGVGGQYSPKIQEPMPAAYIQKIQVISASGKLQDRFKTSEPFVIVLFWENVAGVPCTPNIQMKVLNGDVTALIASDSNIDWTGERKKEKGVYKSEFTIPRNWLNANEYFLSVALDSHSPRVNFQSCIDIIRISIWDPMDENSLARGMFVSVREDAVFWPALECGFTKIS